MKTHTLAFALSIMICFTARADLKWEQTTIELHPTATDKQAVGHFKYQNTGKTPVRFKSIHASCGCTTAQTQKEEVPPGQSGEITATFNIGDRTGTQVKTVTVETDDPTNSKTLLTLKTVIPQQLEISPNFVFWKQGEKPDPKSITVRASKEFTVKHLKVSSSTDDFQTKVEEKGNGEFKIDVQPQDTNRVVSSMLTIQPEDSRRTFYATARIMNAPTIQ
jgi:Protein of unknown function (DUF1573)